MRKELSATAEGQTFAQKGNSVAGLFKSKASYVDLINEESGMNNRTSLLNSFSTKGYCMI